MKAEMGRPKNSENAELPPRMVPRRYPSGVVSYYYNGSERKIPLGRDLNKARLKWATLENASAVAGTFAATVEAWKDAGELKKRGHYTQIQYEKYLTELLLAFGAIPLDSIGTVHCQQYLERRSAKVKANREISLLSTIFNWARRTGRTLAPNPVPGIQRNPEQPRGVYVTDEEFRRAHDNPEAPEWYRETLDLLQLAGQRPGDTLGMMWPHIMQGCIWVTQDKTTAKLRIDVVGELAALFERIRARPRKVKSLYIIADDNGQRITVDRLQKVHQLARGEMTWQIRDVRKKSGTDTEDLEHAQQLLGHASRATTERVYRLTKGRKVKPLR